MRKCKWKCSEVCEHNINVWDQQHCEMVLASVGYWKWEGLQTWGPETMLVRKEYLELTPNQSNGYSWYNFPSDQSFMKNLILSPVLSVGVGQGCFEWLLPGGPENLMWRWGWKTASVFVRVRRVEQASQEWSELFLLPFLLILQRWLHKAMRPPRISVPEGRT